MRNDTQARPEFNHAAFYAALDAQRAELGLNWKQVATQTGVSASTLARMSKGKRADVDGFTALLNWLGLPADDFMTGGSTSKPKPIARITALVHSDDNLDERGKEVIASMLRSAYEQFKKKD
jgi:transcriptional regulator with XRE-family HTH domain